MKFNGIMERFEQRLLPIANKLSGNRHIKAIRDSFLTLLPITLTGGIASVLAAAPITETTTNGFLLAWASFAQENNFILTWINTVTLGAMSLYFAIGLTYYLCRHYKINPFTPLLITIVGFIMLIVEPKELGWAGTIADLSYIGGKGLIPAMIVAFFTVESYRYMTEHHFGKINLPPSVPEVLSNTFAQLVPCLAIMFVYSLFYILFHSMHTSMAGFMYSVIAPTFEAADNLLFVILVTLVTHVLFFLGIHDTAIAGFVGPIREGNLAINAAAQLAGESMDYIYTTPFWVYFCVIGGCGSVLALGFLLFRAKSKTNRYVGRIGLIPSFFGINEPIVFGVPIIMNPIFFIPFIMAPMVNAVCAFLLMKAGVIGKTFSMVSWNMPNIFGAFFSTMDYKAVLFIVLFTIVDMVIYYPFFKVYDKQQVALETQEEAENE